MCTSVRLLLLLCRLFIPVSSTWKNWGRSEKTTHWTLHLSSGTHTFPSTDDFSFCWCVQYVCVSRVSQWILILYKNAADVKSESNCNCQPSEFTGLCAGGAASQSVWRMQWWRRNSRGSDWRRSRAFGCTERPCWTAVGKSKSRPSSW